MNENEVSVLRAEIISVGTEILLGDIVNTNAQYLAQQLAALGFTSYYQSVVGDNPIRLRSLVQAAKERSDILVFTGGLGPTDDDLTKETVAEAFGDSLVMDQEILRELEAFFAERHLQMTPNNRKQALVPKAGRVLHNPHGTAPGAMFRQGDTFAFLLPGPPIEMKRMFDEEVRPILEVLQEEAIRSMELRMVGIGESDLETRVASLLTGSNPSAAVYVMLGEVRIRITARAATAAEADGMCADYAALFSRLLGDLIYSADGKDLEQTVVARLEEKGETIALAESCTGGLLAQRITSVPGASNVFSFGAVTYGNEVKHRELGVRTATLRRHGAVSSQVAAEMAFGAAKKAGATYGVGITGVAGPGGGTPEKPVGLVYIAVAKGNRVVVRKINVGSDRQRDFIRTIATTSALDMVRRSIAGLDIPESKAFTHNQDADFGRAGKPRRRGGAVLRVLIAAVIVVVAVVLIMLAANHFSNSSSVAPRPGFPTSQGLRYGTEEYAAAAREKVHSENTQDPDVTGMIAFPAGVVESLVSENPADAPQTGGGSKKDGDSQNSAESGAPSKATTQADPLKAEIQPLSSSGPAGSKAPASETDSGSGAVLPPAVVQEEGSAPDYAVIPKNSVPGEKATNTMILGGESFTTLFRYLDTANAGEITTFTYFTSQESQIYRVFALYLLDMDEEPPDRFNPEVNSLRGQSTYLTFMLGTRMRSFYDIPVLCTEQDSYMTLCVEDPETPGRRIYVCGRLAGADEFDMDDPSAAPAGAPLMPAALYDENKMETPNIKALYGYWLNWLLTGGVTNSELQLRTGMPDFDSMGGQQESTPPEDAGASSSKADSQASSSAAAAQESSQPSSSQASSSHPSSSPPSSSPSASVSAASAGADELAFYEESPAGSESSGVSQEDSASGGNEGIQRSQHLLTVTMNGQVVTAPAVDILAQICQSEGATLEREAQKALVIAAHSWILNQQGAGNPAPEVVGLPASTQVMENVEDVADTVLSEDGRSPAFTPWCEMASSGTTLPLYVWGGERSYLRRVTTAFEEGRTDWRSYITIPDETVAELAKNALGAQLGETQDRNTWFTDIEVDESGYVTSLKLGGVETTGFDIWQKILVQEGRPLLSSAAFEVVYQGEDGFLFTSYGEGHGCGMSLVSAQGLALDGKSHTAILQHFYPGTKTIRV